ncbi:hypothetical protein [Streptomyces werraensis]|uniref:Uncharacterized protein n=1 Tax=Streptomyces werraensis TaxID=68284 RepID=A0ABV3JP12_9ACTN
MLEQLVFDLAERALLVALVPADEPCCLQSAEGAPYGVTADQAAAVRREDSLGAQRREDISNGERAPGRGQEQAVQQRQGVQWIGQAGPEDHVRVNRHRRPRLRASASGRPDLPRLKVVGRRVVQNVHLPK